MEQRTDTGRVDRVARSLLPHETLAYVFVMNQRRRLRGAIDLVDLLRAAPGTPLGQVELMRTMQLKPEDDATEIARILSDYDLTAAPVVDDETRMIGIVTVDDVLELILPRRPRRPFGSNTE